MQHSETQCLCRKHCLRPNMKRKMDIGGSNFTFDLAAISAVRYRAEYGDSIINHLAECKTPEEVEQKLLWLCHVMIVPDERPEIAHFAQCAFEDKVFFAKAIALKDGLLAHDPNATETKGGKNTERYDEYQILALASAVRIPESMIYELPIMHLLSVANRINDMKSQQEEKVRVMDAAERVAFFGGR